MKTRIKYYISAGLKQNTRHKFKKKTPRFHCKHSNFQKMCKYKPFEPLKINKY